MLYKNGLEIYILEQSVLERAVAELIVREEVAIVGEMGWY